MPKRGENIYKRKDGRWEGRLFSSDSGGKPFSLYGKTYREVKEKMAKRKVQGNTKVCKEKIADAVMLWLASKEKVLKLSSITKYRNLADKHILPFLGNKKVSDMNEKTVSAFVQMLSEGKTNAGILLSSKTIRDILMILEKSVKNAGGKNLAVDRAGVQGKTGRQRQIAVLSDGEQERLERYLLTDADEKKLGLLLCLYAGLRIGEICAMKWECINLGEKTLSVSQTMQRVQMAEPTDGKRTMITETAPKSECSNRVIPIAEFLVEYLQSRKPSSCHSYLLTGSDRYIEPRCYENFYKRVLSATGIPVNKFHTLRHTFATRCIESGVDAKTVSELLGHSTVQLTLDRYVHPTMKAKKNSINHMAISRQLLWSETGKCAE